MKFFNYVGFRKVSKDDLKRIIKWTLISYIIIGFGLLIHFLFLELDYTEFLRRLNTVTLKGFIGYGIYSLLQEIVARGMLQQWLKNKTKNSLIAIFLTTLIFCLCHFLYNYFIIFGAFLISLICGFVFGKDKDIISCFLIHFIIGGWGKMLLFI